MGNTCNELYINGNKKINNLILKNNIIENRGKKNFKLTTGSVFYESFLVSFPIWIPIIYYILLKTFPSSGLFLVYFTFFVFGEIHFGITWLFIFDKKNREFIKKNKFYSTTIPILLVLFFTICWFFVSEMIAFFLSTL